MPAESRRDVPTVWIALVALGCVALVASQLLGFSTVALPAKMLASTAFVALAIASGAMQSRYGRVVLPGLILSWFGDAFLLGETEGLFMAGLVSFLLAHVAYVTAFSIHGVNFRWVLIAAVPVALVSTVVFVWLEPYVQGSMVTPVRAYTVVISCMLIMAIGTRGAGGVALIPAGAALFYFSDLSVAAGQFVQTDFPNYVWGLPFYYAGQVLIARSAGYSVSAAVR
jgi:uncharacterized membrane protein YhhN